MPTISPRDMAQSVKTPYSSAAITAKPPVSPVEGLRQPDTIETEPAKVETDSKPDAKVEQLSPKFAELARREKLYNEKRKAIEAKESELKAREAQFQSADDYKASLKGKFTQSPLEALSELGLSYDQITQLMLNQPKPEELQYQQLQQEIKALKAANEKTVADMQAAQKSQYEQAVTQIRNEVKMLVDSDGTYETVKEMGAQDSIVELIEETFKQKGYLMTIEEASKQVEDYLVEEAFKMANLKKVQARLKPTPAEVPTQDLAAAKAKQDEAPIKTLTNTVSQSASRPLSNKEKRERAILAFQGKLQG
jgi:ribosome-binding ATPase YchF (GTP1/OBG family)